MDILWFLFLADVFSSVVRIFFDPGPLAPDFLTACFFACRSAFACRFAISYGVAVASGFDIPCEFTIPSTPTTLAVELRSQ
jgi:hypothetical protein